MTHYLTIIEFFVSTAVIAAGALYIYYTWAFTYWKKKNLQCITEPKIPYGNIEKVFPNKTNIGMRFKKGYDYAKSQGKKHAGVLFFTSPQYFVIDPEYIKNILQRDFNYFTDRGFYYNERDDPLSANLFALGGEKWRTLRTKLSPAFTSGKLKMMIEILVKCGYQMQDEIEKLYASQQPVNVKDISQCFTIDVIGSSAFGLECNCFKNPDAEFKRQGKKIFHFPLRRLLTTITAFAFPNFSRWLGIKLFDKETTEFFMNVVKDSVEFREKHNLHRKDILQLLLELKDELNDGDTEEQTDKSSKLTLEELTAQVFIFFAAGFETSSTTLTFCLFELASNSEIQEKVRDEIIATLTKHEGKITYDAIMDMKYMNQVIEETLRKYPPVSYLTRVCVKDYQVPGTETIIEKGIVVALSILGLHHDPEFYPEPDKFDPERFSEENKQQRLPFTYIPFGEGPRICIGLRFGLMQIKVALTVLLKSYRYSLNNKTELPLEIEPYSFTFVPKTGIYLNIEKIL